MKLTKTLSLLLVLLMLLSATVSCSLFNGSEESEATDTESVDASTDTEENTESESDTVDDTESDIEEDTEEEKEETVITMSGVTSTAGLTGDLTALWKPEEGTENIITGECACAAQR